MIAISASVPTESVPAWYAGFMRFMPSIRQHASLSFRELSAEAREEAVQEVLCHAMVVYARLVELGKISLAYPMVLARYGIARYRDGRRAGSRMNVPSGR